MSAIVTFNPQYYDPILELVDSYVRADEEPFNGKAKRDQLAHEARIQGRKAGIAQGLATYVNGERLRYYSKCSAVEVCTPYSVFGFLNDCLEMHKNHTEQIEAASDPNNAPAVSDVEALTKKLDSELADFVSANYPTLIRTTHMDQVELERHREAVAAGKEEMNDEDRDWIAAAQAKAQAEADRLSKLAADLGVTTASGPVATP